MENNNLQVIKFNESYKVGDPIRYLNEQKQEVTAAIRFHAELLEGGIQVVWVKDRINAVNLNDVI